MMNKKSGKRVLSWLLAAAMLIALMPANALAKGGGHGGGSGEVNPQQNNVVEFWCTNSAVEVDGKTSTTLSNLLSNKSQLVFAQETSLQTGTLSDGSNLTGNLWKVMVQENNNKQTGNQNDNKTNVGTEITAIWGERNNSTLKYEYKYLTKEKETKTLSPEETVVVYYKQVFVKNSSYGIIYGADWGYSSPTEGFPIQVTYQFVLEHSDGTTEQLTSKDYWYNNNKNASIAEIGTLLNPQYEISKITVDNEIRTSDNNEVTLKRDKSHVVTFYIKKVETTTVKYHWIGPDSFADTLNITLPTDSKEYNWGDTATLTDEAAAFTPYLIKKGSDGVRYMFSGWYDNSALNGNPVDSITVSDSKDTFYGRWTSPAVEVNLNKDDNGTNRFEKTLRNAEKLSDNDAREFTISITNDDSDETYTGTATVTKNNHSNVPFVFDDSQKMVFDIYDVEFDEQNNPLPGGTDYTYTVRETSDSSDDIEFDNATYKMKVNLKLDGKDLVATVTFADKDDAEITETPITFTNTYAPAYPVYVYGYFSRNGSNQITDKKVNGNDISQNEDNTGYFTFGKIARGTKTEAAKEAPEPTLLFKETDLNNLVNVFDGQGQGDASSNNVTLSNVNRWGNVHACPGAASYNTPEEDLTTDIYAWHLDGAINVYTVAYDANGSGVTNMPDNPEGYFFGNYTTADTPTREGYDFQGWKVKGTDTVYDANHEFTLNGDVTLVAQWTLSEATITFEIFGGKWDKNFIPEVQTPTDAITKKLKLTNGSEKLSEIGIPEGSPSDGYTIPFTWHRDTKDGSEISNIDNEIVKGNATYVLTFKPDVKKTKADVTFKIENGTWIGKPEGYEEGQNKGTITIKDIELTNGKATLNKSAFPEGSADTNCIGGEWFIEGSTTPIDIESGFEISGNTTFVLKFVKQQYTIEYQWSTDHPSDITDDLLPAATTKDGLAPTDEPTIKNLNKGEASYTTTSTKNSKGEDGTWEFTGWTPERSTDGTKITFTGNWVFTKEIKPIKTGEATVTFRIVGGTATINGKDNVKEETLTITLYDNKTDRLKEVDLPTNLQPDKDHIGEGYWDGSTLAEMLTKDLHNGEHFIYTYKFIKRGTVAAELSKLIQKEFTAQYNYGTEATFAATAEVTTGSAAKPYAAEETLEAAPEEARIYDGTVTLKTGETASFTFSAKDRMADVLTPNTHYTVKVSEDKGSLSKVTYDTTKYILTFDTNQDAVVGNILIWKDGEDGKTENKTITFHNIYTYKRHHSSDDGGNGGKKDETPTVEITDDDALGLNDTDHFAYIVGYGNGEVRPQNSITRAEVAAIFFRLLEDDVRDANYTRQNKFTDVSNDAWYCSAVSTLSAMGIISGYPDATFRPNASITRAEFAAIATRFDVNGDKTPVSFSDIAGHWAKDEIAVAANNGWVNGYEDGSFRPQNKITRAETMSLVNRVLNRRPETAEDLLENMTKWTDNADTNAWYYLAVQEATNSHYYEYKENSQYEKWTELRETRDWSELDK